MGRESSPLRKVYVFHFRKKWLEGRIKALKKKNFFSSKEIVSRGGGFSDSTTKKNLFFVLLSILLFLCTDPPPSGWTLTFNAVVREFQFNHPKVWVICYPCLNYLNSPRCSKVCWQFICKCENKMEPAILSGCMTKFPGTSIPPSSSPLCKITGVERGRGGGDG